MDQPGRATRRAAQHTLARLTAAPQTWTVAAVRGPLDQLPDIPRVLASADPTAKRALYASLGVVVTYHPDRRLAMVQARPLDAALGGVSVGGPTRPPTTYPALQETLRLPA